MVPFAIVEESQCVYISKEIVKSTVDCGSSTTSSMSQGSMYQILQVPSLVAATTWKHDDELGRGYLLISTCQDAGKIWQWETGGGPIPIGRTLHLQDAGCRSRGPSYCNAGRLSGSGGIAVDVWHEPLPRLIVAEWGEERIVRLEPESGARTPLVVKYYDETTLRYPVQQPRQLLMTAFGDLLILDRHEERTYTEEEEDEARTTTTTTTDVLWQLSRVSRIPPLLSLAESREAHAWTSLNTTSASGSSTTPHQPPQLILQQSKIGGVALVPQEWLKLYVTMEVAVGKVVLATLSLDKEDDDQEAQSKILLDYSQYSSQAGSVVVDEKGRLYLAVDQGILIVEGPPTSAAKIVGHITMPNVTDPIVSMTLGEDRFLYLATAESLYRMRMRHKPMAMPINLVIK
jgi:hypothetical protein